MLQCDALVGVMGNPSLHGLLNERRSDLIARRACSGLAIFSLQASLTSTNSSLQYDVQATSDES